MSINAQWQQAKERYDALTLRERAIIAAAAVAGILFLGSSFLVEPRLARAKSLSASIEQQSQEAANLSNQLAALRAQVSQDPDAARKSELEVLKVKLQDVNGQLGKVEGAYVPPERMNVVLDTLLKRHPGLRLVSLKTLGPMGLLDQVAEKGGASLPAADFDIFRHGVEIQLEGSYSDLHGYLAQLEQGPQKFIWGEVRLAVVEYPRSLLTMVVYTLNSDKVWLSL